MPQHKCGACGYVGRAQTCEITMTRSGVLRRFQMMWCITCWITLSNLLEPQSVGFTDGLPFRSTSTSRTIARRTRE